MPRSTRQRAIDRGEFLDSDHFSGNTNRVGYHVPSARFGPNGIRQGSRMMGLTELDPTMGIKVADNLEVVDCGDVREFVSHKSNAFQLNHV